MAKTPAAGRPSAAVVSSGPAGERMLKALERAGFAAASFPAAGPFISSLASAVPDLAAVDTELPDLGGADLALALRRNPPTAGVTLIIFSAAPRVPAEVVTGLDSGADDYLSPLPPPEELDARLRNLLERGLRGRAGPASAGDSMRQGVPVPPVIRAGGLEVDLSARTVTACGKAADLTSLEFDLLVFFLNHPNRVIARGTLMEALWKDPASASQRAVDKRVEALRAKLGGFAARIETVFGMGYLLRLNDEC
ncbi:MAG: transcriptional regulator [Elusimicrobia bacterium]|nr:MAG: transcriptional regulator [Elusimicrobiota bacterium]KAF0158372.1 MAG: transcriptional regulator [Elusimicrobiota bacterium]